MTTPLRDPRIQEREHARFRCTVGGEQVATGHLTVTPADVDGEPGYVQEILGDFDGQAEYDNEVRFAARDGRLLPVSYRLSTMHAGRTVAREEGWFGEALALTWGGALEPYPEDMYPLLGMAVALRGLDFTPGRRRRVSVWLSNTVHWELGTRVERNERLRTPAGELPAWKVRVWPEFGRVAPILNQVVRRLLPPFVLHYDAEPPHRFLRFAFPTGPFPWNKRGVIELVEIVE